MCTFFHFLQLSISPANLVFLITFKFNLIIKSSGQKIYKEFWEIDWTNSSQIYMTTGYVGGGGLIAFCMEIFEFLVVTYTSSLTLSIIGILKVKGSS